MQGVVRGVPSPGAGGTSEESELCDLETGDSKPSDLLKNCAKAGRLFLLRALIQRVWQKLM